MLNAVSSLPMVLVAEDDPDQSEMLCEALTMSGFLAVPAQTGDAAWKQLMQQRFSVVLLDVNMPGINGREILRKLRKEQHSSVPVIVLSAYLSNEDQSTLKQEGATCSFPKPYAIDEVLLTVGKLARVIAPTTEVHR